MHNYIVLSNYSYLMVICFNQDGAATSLNDKPLKLLYIYQFIYIGSNISSTENNINICIYLPIVKWFQVLLTNTNNSI